MKQLAFFTLSLLLASAPAIASAEIAVTKGQQTVYHPQDTIEVLVTVHTVPETCLDGMKHTKVFVSGLEIETQSEWAMIKKGLWQKKLRIVVLDKGSPEAKITVLRRVDKEQIFQQTIFKVQGRR